jgi:hypothetical protein
MPLGVSKAGLMGASGGEEGNYFGSSGDGSLTTSGNVTYTVANKNGDYDGDMVVKNYSSLTIASGHTITVDQPCRGMLIYVAGDVSITGTLSMSSMGGKADPTASGGSDSSAVNSSGLQLGMFTASGSDSLAAATFAGSGDAAVAAVANQPAISGDGTIFSIARVGASGGNAASGGQNASSNGNAGSNGTTGAATISTGGASSGALNVAGGVQGTSSSGAGGDGGCFSGGAGGGGCGTVGPNNARTAGAGADYGGEGGSGASGGQGYAGSSAGGGAGNPKGGGGSDSSSDGCGGLIWLVASGDVTVNSGGSIVAKGNRGKTGTSNGVGGGSSGGGAIMILHGGTYTNNGTVSAAGGIASSGSQNGQAGGAGGIHNAQVSE